MHGFSSSRNVSAHTAKYFPMRIPLRSPSRSQHRTAPMYNNGENSMKSCISLLLLLITISLHAQSHSSCCHVDPTVSMAMLAADPDFAALHAEPLPFPDPS